jgi:hypothetical protein
MRIPMPRKTKAKSKKAEPRSKPGPDPEVLVITGDPEKALRELLKPKTPTKKR